MPSASLSRDPWPAPLARRVAVDADVQHISAAIVSTWHDIDKALSPVLGHRGVAALYRRCLNLCSEAHPWLLAAQTAALAELDTSPLAAALLQQTPAAAGQAGTALFAQLHELLCSLVGPSLTDRLLNTVWAHSSGAAPEQELSP